MQMLEEANETVTQIIQKASVQLATHRKAGGEDAEFVRQMMNAFHEQAMVSPLGSGAKHMALSVYRMVWQQELIKELAEKVSMRDSALEMLFELQEM